MSTTANLPSPSPSAPPRAERKLTVLNELGIHARPAVDVVRCARQFTSKILIVRHGESFSAQDLLQVLVAGLTVGTQFHLIAEGPDAHAAIEALDVLLREFAAQENTQRIGVDGFNFGEQSDEGPSRSQGISRVESVEARNLSPARLVIVRPTGNQWP